MSPYIPHWTPMDFSADTNPRKGLKHVPLIQNFSLALFVNNQNASFPIHPDVESSSSSHEKESCRPCFYTGLATCAGFAGYFFYLATDPQNLKHRKFLLASSTAWTLAGVYRYYLN